MLPFFKREWVEKEEAEKNIQKEGFLGGFPPWSYGS